MRSARPGPSRRPGAGAWLVGGQGQCSSTFTTSRMTACPVGAWLPAVGFDRHTVQLRRISGVRPCPLASWVATSLKPASSSSASAARRSSPVVCGMTPAWTAGPPEVVVGAAVVGGVVVAWVGAGNGAGAVVVVGGLAPPPHAASSSAPTVTAMMVLLMVPLPSRRPADPIGYPHAGRPVLFALPDACDRSPPSAAEQPEHA